MKHRVLLRRALPLAVLAAVLYSAGWPASAFFFQKDEVAPTVAAMTKNGPAAEPISFSEEDFVVEGSGKLDSIVIATLPDAAVGCLTLGAQGIQVGDVIAMEAVDGLRFTPLAAPAGLEAQFQFTPVFSDGRSGDAVTVELYLLAEANGAPVAENLEFNGQDLKRISEKQRRQLVGAEVAMIFQDPMTSLNPCYTVGFQIMEAIKVHQGGNKSTRRQRAIDLLNQVGIPDPASRLDVYPHQLSGGMSQRVMIAMAIACRPKLLIADEPTTALDVTIQAQIIELLLELQQKENMALVLITHDLALVAEAAHKIIVMYAGQVVETGDAHAIFHAPRHPYTQALLRALPEFAQDKERLASLPGVVPGKYDRPNGCLLNPRCPYATDRCRAEEPALNMLTDGRQSKCHYPLDDAGRPTL